MANQANQVGYGTAAPTDTTQYYSTGDVIVNNAPAASVGYVSQWRCVAGGYPGTWVADYAAPSLSLTTTATTGTLTAGYKLILLNAATGPTLSLPLVASHPAGFEVIIKNIANNSATLSPVAANGYDAAAITLAQYAVVRLISNGSSTNWYKSA